MLKVQRRSYGAGVEEESEQWVHVVSGQKLREVCRASGREGGGRGF